MKITKICGIHQSFAILREEKKSLKETAGIFECKIYPHG